MSVYPSYNTMELKQLTPEEYAATFDSFAPHIYNTSAFAIHNEKLAEEVLYLALASSGKLRLGIILGLRDKRLLSPFSAPFGGMTAHGYQSMNYYQDFASLLLEFARQRHCEISVTLPPDFYSPGHIAKQTAALSAIGKILYTDINFHRQLTPGTPIRKAFFAKTNNQLRGTDKHSLETLSFGAENPENVARAYNIFSANHAALGYPMNMTLEQVIATAKITSSHFTVLNIDGKDAAASMINTSKPDIAQVIYWGDLLEMRKYNPMIKLAEITMERYTSLGFKHFDIGPSSSQGVPAAGLCRFKESVGCVATIKPTIALR